MDLLARQVARAAGERQTALLEAVDAIGDFHRLHRMGLIACYYRAAEWEHTEVMLAAHNLLVYLDRSRT